MSVFKSKIAINHPKTENHLTGSPAILKNNTAPLEQIA